MSGSVVRAECRSEHLAGTQPRLRRTVGSRQQMRWLQLRHSRTALPLRHWPQLNGIPESESSRGRRASSSRATPFIKREKVSPVCAEREGGGEGKKSRARIQEPSSAIPGDSEVEAPDAEHVAARILGCRAVALHGGVVVRQGDPRRLRPPPSTAARLRRVASPSVPALRGEARPDARHMMS